MNTAAVSKREPGERTMSTTVVVISWVLRLIAAAILVQTLYFKFTGAPESVYIFTKVHAEPWGRIGSGVVELIAAVLLLWPRFTWAGAVVASGVMAGAIMSHLTLLGIEVQGDHGLLFVLALTVFFSSAFLLIIHRSQLPIVGGLFQ